jgi:hypothetical protein
MARRTSNDPQAIANVLRLIPAKWLVGMLVALVLYFFLQPKLNAWFGWNLPSIAAMAGNETPAKPASPKSASPKSASPKSASPKPAQPKAAQPEQICLDEAFGRADEVTGNGQDGATGRFQIQDTQASWARSLRVARRVNLRTRKRGGTSALAHRKAFGRPARSAR